MPKPTGKFLLNGAICECHKCCDNLQGTHKGGSWILWVHVCHIHEYTCEVEYDFTFTIFSRDHVAKFSFFLSRHFPGCSPGYPRGREKKSVKKVTTAAFHFLLSLSPHVHGVHGARIIALSRHVPANCTIERICYLELDMVSTYYTRALNE